MCLGISYFMLEQILQEIHFPYLTPKGAVTTPYAPGSPYNTQT